MLKHKIIPYSTSEYETLKEVILCSPAKKNITGAEVNAVGFVGSFNADLAIEQHQSLKSTLEDFGCIVHDIDSEKEGELWNSLVNRIFVRDIGAVLGDKIILGSSSSDVRLPDFLESQSLLIDMFDDKDTYYVPSGSFLEFGDFMIINENCILINTGHRSHNKEVLAHFLFELGIEEIGFVSLPKNVQSLHLDVACNILGNTHFLAASFLKFIPVSVHTKSNKSEKLKFLTINEFVTRHGYSIHWLPNQPYLLDYTNFINLDSRTALISNQVHTYYTQEFPEMDFITVEVNELQNGAGSIRCLTLPVVRNS